MKLKSLLSVLLFLVSFALKSQCTLANYMAAIRIPIASFPYTATSAPSLTVSAINSGAPTLGNSTYACDGNSYGGASPAWWLNGAAQSLTFNFSSPVTNLTFLINGTNSTEVFYIVSNSPCAISLSNYCAIGYTSVGGTLTAGATAGLGSLITVNNPAGATQYVMTHNGLGAGSRVTLLDCFVVGSGPCVLPVELSNFNAQCRSNNSVELNWTTMTEYNNDFFTIEKSADGENWEKIADVKASGNSFSQKNYSYRYNDNINSIVYFRLKQTDYNKDFKYSQIVTLYNCNQKGKGTLVVFPNPASSELTLNTDIDGMEIEIYNLLGVKEASFNLERGDNKLDISKLSSGAYYLQAHSEQSDVKVQKIIINK